MRIFPFEFSQLQRNFSFQNAIFDAQNEDLFTYFLSSSFKYRVSQKKFTRWAGYGIKSMRPISKTKMLIRPLQANLDEKILFGKIKQTPCKGLVWETRIPRSTVVHDLCRIDICIASLKYRIRMSIEGKLWTRIECGIFVPNHAL